MTAWTPIIAAGTDDANRAWDAIGSIAEALMDGGAESRREPRNDIFQFTPARRAEDALVYSYLALSTGRQEWLDLAVTSAGRAADEVAPFTRRFALYSGLGTVGWVLQHMSERLENFPGAEPIAEDQDHDPDSDLSADGGADAADEAADAGEDIDRLLLERLENGPGSDGYDLISGLVGMGIYLLERLPRPSAVAGIRRIVADLAEIARYSSSGVAWFTAASFLPEWQREKCPEGYYNLGVAHGIPGVLAFLSEVYASGVEVERSGQLLEGCMRWMMANQNPAGSLCRFESWIPSGGLGQDTRLAWCYGDMGILAVMLQVARRAGRDDWREFAHELLEQCLNRSGAASFPDAALCHGAVGAAHMFNRIYQAEGDERCRTAALAWYGQALSMRRPETGVGGFLAFTRPPGATETIWDPDPTFLSGAGGIALALLAALTPVAPEWDRLLLLSGVTDARLLTPDRFAFAAQAEKQRG